METCPNRQAWTAVLNSASAAAGGGFGHEREHASNGQFT